MEGWDDQGARRALTHCERLVCTRCVRCLEREFPQDAHRRRLAPSIPGRYVDEYIESLKHKIVVSVLFGWIQNTCDPISDLQGNEYMLPSTAFLCNQTSFLIPTRFPSLNYGQLQPLRTCSQEKSSRRPDFLRSDGRMPKQTDMKPTRCSGGVLRMCFLCTWAEDLLVLWLQGSSSDVLKVGRGTFQHLRARSDLF
jgi:hypothetical protein